MAVGDIKVSFKCETNKFLLYALYPIWKLQAMLGIRNLIFIDKVIKVSVKGGLNENNI